MYCLIVKYNPHNGYGNITCVESDDNNNTNILSDKGHMTNRKEFYCQASKHAMNAINNIIKEAQEIIEKRRGGTAKFIISRNNIIFE